MTAATATDIVTVRKDNPLCGDVIELDVALAGDRVGAVAHRQRACSLTLASARALATVVAGGTSADARELAARVERAMRGQGPLPAGLEAVAPALLLPSRRSCVLLPWRALLDALDQI